MILARKFCFLMIFFSLVLFSLFHRVPAQAVERIVISPARPQVGQLVTFRAVNWFDTPCVLWLFGDGTQDEDAVDPFTTTHRYEEPGTYTVKAHYDCDPVSEHVTTTITVSERETTPSFGPAADFKISAVQLRFKEGRPYVEIPKNTSDFRAYADIKYEGTGTLRLQWLVDGKPIHFQTKVLSFARQTVIDSVRGLPTTVTGPHDVSLRFLEPEADFEIPVIRYFVKVDASDVQTATDIGLSIKGVMDAEGGMLPLLNNTIRAEAETPVILDGRIENRQPWAVAQGILNIYAGEKLVDRQLVRNLKPGEERDFQVSMLSPEQGERLVRIELTDKAGAVLQTSLLNLQPLDVPEIKPAPLLISDDTSLAPPKKLKDIPEPATLPKGIIAKLELRPREVVSHDDFTSENVYLNYHIENFLWVRIFESWREVKKGWTLIYEDVRVYKDKEKKLMELDEKQSRFHKGTLSFSPKYVPESVYFQGVYYDRRSKEKYHKDKLGKYSWSQRIEAYEPFFPAKIYWENWDFMKSDLVVGDGNTALVYFEHPLLHSRPHFIPVNISVEVGNGGYTDAGEIQVGVDESVLPKNWQCHKGTLPYLSRQTVRNSAFSVLIPMTEKPRKSDRICFDLVARVDLAEKYTKHKNAPNKIPLKVCLMKGSVPNTSGPSGPGSVLNYGVDPVIREYKASDRALISGESAVISYALENTAQGRIYKYDPTTLKIEDTLKIFEAEKPVKADSFQGVIKDTPNKRTAYELRVFGPEDGGKRKKLVKTVVVDVYDKKMFLDKPLIQVFKGKPEKVKGGQPCTLLYEMSPCAYAEILDVKSGDLIPVKTKGPGKSVRGSVRVFPQQSTTIYELRCGNTMGESSRQVKIRVVGGKYVDLIPKEPDIIRFAPRTLNLDWNQTGKLDVMIENCNKALIMDADTGQQIMNLTPRNRSYNEMVFVSPRKDTTYSLQASNENGKSVAYASISMPEDAPVVYNFRVLKPKNLMLQHGETVTLAYHFDHADKASIYDYDRQKLITQLSAGPSKNQGVVSFQPDKSTTYLLLVENPLGRQGSKMASRITVTYPKSLYANKKPLIYQFKANTNMAANGDQISLTYEFTGAESAVIYRKNDPKALDVLPVGKPGQVVQGGLKSYESFTDTESVMTYKKNDLKVLEVLPVGKPGQVIKGESKKRIHKTTSYILKCKNSVGVDTMEVQIRVE